MARKLRQINESLNGYEPEGREFESLRAHHLYCGFRGTVERYAAGVYPGFAASRPQGLCVTLNFPGRFPF